MKGDTLITHTLFFLFSIAMVMIIIVSFGTIRKDAQNFIGNNELQQVCAIIRTSMEKIYAPDDYVSASDTRLGKITVDLPERIADANYVARFVNASIVVETNIQNLNKTCETGMNVNFTGFTSGGRTQFEFTRYSTGGGVITMARVRT